MTYHRRDDWGARPRRSNPSRINPQGAAVHYVDERVADVGHDQCAGVVRSIQAMHLDSRGWADIAYNMLVCRHGDVFEGRGIGVRSAANGTDAGNSGWVAICALLGNETIPEPTKAGINEAARILGVADGNWTVHQDHFNTSCPGPVLRDWVRSGHPSTGGQPRPEPPKEDQMFSKSPPNTGHVVNLGTHRALDIGGEPKGGSPIIVWPGEGQLKQRIEVIGHGDNGHGRNEYSLVFRTGHALDSPSPMKVHAVDFDGGNGNQRVFLVPHPAVGEVWIIEHPRHNGAVLTVDADGSLAFRSRKDDNARQLWLFAETI